ncbi:MAG: prepilin-type N-terminal cleavage/methylation domain-containing protein [Nitrospirae bacterium]|nr:prepilin-type N-terminal cleavage/methylation domain-containing protein [Nitrospirota bacterium]
MRYKSHIANEKAFTLVEIIVTMLVMGIVAVLAGYGIVQVTEGYVYIKTNSETQQKALLAMNRIERELIIISSVTATSASPTSISYNSYKQSATPSSHTLAISGKTITVDGDVLVDLVSGFSLSYLDTYNMATPSSTWLSSSKIIQYTISLTDTNGNTKSFTNRVVPRDL